MPAAGAMLGGVPLQLRSGEVHGWSLVAGLEPHIREFQVTSAAAEEIYTRAGAQFSGLDPRTTQVRAGAGRSADPVGPLVLDLQGGANEAKVSIAGLYVIARGPGDDRLNTASLLVADRRWLWRNVVIERRYNVRRATPETRWIDGRLTPLEVARVEADITHERVTLREGGVLWTANTVLDDLLSLLCGAGGYDLGRLPLSEPVQDLELHDQGPAALGRALALVPGVVPWIDVDGKAKTLAVFDGSDKREMEARDRAILAGNWGVPDRARSLPSKIYVGFEREHEIRFDFSETDATALATAARPTPGREEPTLENVLPQPDPTLAVKGQTVAMGTYLRFADWLTALAAVADYPSAAGAFTQAKILRWYLAGFSALHHLYSSDMPGAPNLLWERRLSAALEHYRATFRVLPQWVDKVRFVAARRAAIVSQETGARARSEVFTDYVVKPTYRGLAPNGQRALGANVTGYAAQLASARPAPFTVEVLDERVGILRITPRVDLYGNGAKVAPGTLSAEFPEATPAARFLLWHQVPLSAAWSMSVVLTVVPSAPNDHRRLWWEEVPAGDAARSLIGHPTMPTAEGPPRHVLSGDDTARFAWLDDRATEIKESIWTGQPPPADLMVNRQTIRDVAVAQAARVLAPLMPRVVGKVVVSLDAKAKPTGNIQVVTHEIRDSGGRAVAVTTLEAPAPGADPPSVFSLLPERSRKILARLVET